MSKISFTMGNVSDVAVSPINADATIRQGNATNTLVFAGIVVSPKGAPYEVIPVNKGNWQDKLGKPYHSSFGVHADSLRSLGEALEGGDGIVVRVVPSSATYPAIKVSKPDAEIVAANEVLAYGADLSLQEGEFLALAIKDGANSDKRKVRIDAADPVLYGEGMFILSLTETLAAGGVETLEELVVSFEPEATDSMGSPAFIETVIESKSKHLLCVVDAPAAQLALTALPETAFTGASNGALNDITSADYDKAIEVLRNTVAGYNYVVGLSCYDPAVQAKLISIMNDKRISGAFDVNPRLIHAEGLAAKQGLNLNEPRANFTHFPYTSKCPYYGNRVMFGLSGTVFRAKAKGVAKTSPIGGWHYTPAGVDRAVISRAGLAPMKNLDTPDYEAMYKARLNKVAVSENGNLFIDDSLTCCAQENYLRFEQVVSVMDAISRDFYALANRLKHQPDGITSEGLEDGMKAIGEGYKSVDAVVPPRNPDQDGEDGFVYKVEQVEIDLWKITWSVCVTGSGRRFIGEPILVR